MSRLNLRKRKRICYYEPEEPPFDEYIYCSDCRDYVYEYCSIHGPLLVVPDDKMPVSECSLRSPCRAACASGRIAGCACRPAQALAMAGRWWTPITNQPT